MGHYGICIYIYTFLYICDLFLCVYLYSEYTSTGLCVNDVYWLPNVQNDTDNKDCAFIRFYDDLLLDDDYCSEKHIFLCNNMLYQEHNTDTFLCNRTTTSNSPLASLAPLDYGLTSTYTSTSDKLMLSGIYSFFYLHK